MLWAYCRVIRCHPQALVVGRRRLATTTGSGILKIEKHIQEALAYGKPVVALESTIVAHGMPYPENLELAQAVESILRAKVSKKWKFWHTARITIISIDAPSKLFVVVV